MKISRSTAFIIKIQTPSTVGSYIPTESSIPRQECMSKGVAVPALQDHVWNDEVGDGRPKIDDILQLYRNPKQYLINSHRLHERYS